MAKFHKRRETTPEGILQHRTFFDLRLEKDISLLNIVNKFDTVLISKKVLFLSTRGTN